MFILQSCAFKWNDSMAAQSLSTLSNYLVFKYLLKMQNPKTGSVKEVLSTLIS